MSHHNYSLQHHERMDDVDEEEIDVEGYDDDDYEDDDDVDLAGLNYRGGSSSGPDTDGGDMLGVLRGGSGAVEARKEHHNKLERKRRLSIKCSFNQLKENIPSLKGEKASRAYILQKAVEHIEEMKAKSRAHASDVENLSRQNKQLEKEIAEYERVIVQLESMQRQKARERAETAAAATMRLRQQQAQQAAAKAAGESSSSSSSSGSPSATASGGATTADSPAVGSVQEEDTEQEDGQPRRKRTRPASTSVVTIRAESPSASSQVMRPPPAPSEGKHVGNTCWSPSRTRSISSSATPDSSSTVAGRSQYAIRTTVVVRPGQQQTAAASRCVVSNLLPATDPSIKPKTDESLH